MHRGTDVLEFANELKAHGEAFALATVVRTVAAGIRAALPHVDLYAPANTLKSLTELEPYLARL